MSSVAVNRKSAPLSPNNRPPPQATGPFLTPQHQTHRHRENNRRRPRSSGAFTSRKPTNSQQEAIQIAVRVRPEQNYETTSVLEKTEVGVSVDEPKSRGKKSFEFETVFDDGTTRLSPFEMQRTVYKQLGRPLLDAFVEGYNCTLLAYGQTGSGKTFSISGTDAAPGLLPNFCKQLFDQLESALSAGDARIEVSYLEIYQEKVYDLLVAKEKNAPSMRVREHPKQGPYVEGLCSNPVGSYEDLEKWFRLGTSRRATASTGMNEQSSRSHAIFQVKLNQTRTETVNDQTHHFECASQANLVDLAGSERSSQAQENATNKETRQKETNTINRSLATLKFVIKTLSEKCAHTNYRDSSLTWLLKESLGGNARTALLATVRRLESQREETISTLRFASQARAVMTEPTKNEDQTYVMIQRLKQLEEENAKLKETADDPNVLKKLAQFERIKETMQEKIERQEAHARRDREDYAFRLQRAETELILAQGLLDKSGLLSYSRLDLSRGAHLVELSVDPQLCSVFKLDHQRQMISLGHDLTCDIVLEGALICDFHCEFVHRDSDWLLMSRQHEVFRNGAKVDEIVKLHHLDRICVGGERFLLVLLQPDDLVTVFKDHNYHSAHAELLKERVEELERNARTEEEKKLEEDKEAALKELESQLEEQRSLKTETEERLKDARKKAARQTELEGEQQMLKAEMTALKQQLNERTSELEMTREYKAQFERQLEELMVERDQFWEEPQQKSNFALAKMEVEEANGLLEQMGKSTLFNFTCEQFVEEHSGLITEFRLHNKKQGLSCVLDVQTFSDRVEALRSLYVAVHRPESEFQKILYNRSDDWYKTGGRASDLLSAAMVNSLKRTAVNRQSSASEVKNVLVRPSMGGRKSTISRVLECSVLEEEQLIPVASIDQSRLFLCMNRVSNDLTLKCVGLSSLDQLLWQCFCVFDATESLSLVDLVSNAQFAISHVCSLTSRLAIIQSLSSCALNGVNGNTVSQSLPCLSNAALDACADCVAEVQNHALAATEAARLWLQLRSKGLLDGQSSDVRRIKQFITELIASTARFLLVSNSSSAVVFQTKYTGKVKENLLKAFVSGYCEAFAQMVKIRDDGTEINQVLEQCLDDFVQVLNSLANEESSESLHFVYETLGIGFAQPLLHGALYFTDKEFHLRQRTSVLEQLVGELCAKLEQHNVELERRLLPLSAVSDESGKPMSAYEWLDDSLNQIAKQLAAASPSKTERSATPVFYTPVQAFPSERFTRLELSALSNLCFDDIVNL